MFRKLILTALLTVLYSGTPPQLGGSLLTIFVFLLAHVIIKPYIDQGKFSKVDDLAYAFYKATMH